MITTTNVKNNGSGNTSTPQTVNASITKNPVPIKLNTKVLADNTSNGWTNTGWVVKKGQRIRIVGVGRISLGNGRYTTPSGVASIPDSEKLMNFVNRQPQDVQELIHEALFGKSEAIVTAAA